jgi:diguanylate cyclase (GGDEF)-like protein
MHIMTESPEITNQFYRMDALTTCYNLLAFIEQLTAYYALESRPPMSMMLLDIKSFADVNSTHGHAHGDYVLRSIGLALQDEAALPVYRVGEDEFSVVFPTGSIQERTALARRIFCRINREAGHLSLSAPVANVALVHDSKPEQFTPGNVLFQLSLAMAITKHHRETSFQEFAASELLEINDSEAIRWVAERAMDRIVALGAMLDETHRLAYTDPITGLPNSRAAHQKLAEILAQAGGAGQPVSILMIDGDNLKAYNNAGGYAAGDEMICNLGKPCTTNCVPATSWPAGAWEMNSW